MSNRFVKYVDYRRSEKRGDRTLHPIVTVRVPGHNRVLHAPRANVKLVNLGIQQAKFGF